MMKKQGEEIRLVFKLYRIVSKEYDYVKKRRRDSAGSIGSRRRL